MALTIPIIRRFARVGRSTKEDMIAENGRRRLRTAKRTTGTLAGAASEARSIAVGGVGTISGERHDENLLGFRVARINVALCDLGDNMRNEFDSLRRKQEGQQTRGDQNVRVPDA